VLPRSLDLSGRIPSILNLVRGLAAICLVTPVIAFKPIRALSWLSTSRLVSIRFRRGGPSITRNAAGIRPGNVSPANLSENENEAEVLKNFSSSWSRLASQMDLYMAIMRKHGKYATSMPPK
jgi:hypothetical protein